MKNIKWHILFWVPYFFAAYIADSIQDPTYTTFTKELIFFLTQNIYLFYGLYYGISKFSASTVSELLKSILRFLVIVIFWMALRYFIRYHFMATFYEPEYASLPINQWLTSCFIGIVNSFFYSMAYFLLIKSIRNQKELLLSKEETFQEETLALRAQINPHFLYNTLDLLYAKALPKDKELSESIMLLSDIMRYSIRPQGERGFVNLADEVAHLKNLIEINRLRFNGNFNLDFTQDGPISVTRIIPIILMTLTENVFKYGVLHDKQHPAHIHLMVNQDGCITFITVNTIRRGPKELSTGIGLKNVQRRLQRAYGNNYSFIAKAEGDTFHTSLIIHS